MVVLLCGNMMIEVVCTKYFLEEALLLLLIISYCVFAQEALKKNAGAINS